MADKHTDPHTTEIARTGSLPIEKGQDNSQVPLVYLRDPQLLIDEMQECVLAITDDTAAVANVERMARIAFFMALLGLISSEQATAARKFLDIAYSSAALRRGGEDAGAGDRGSVVNQLIIASQTFMDKKRKR